MNSSDGILLATYPANLSDADLVWLRETAEDLGRKSSKYADWLTALVEAEAVRRAAEGTAEPVEVTVPRFNASRWTGADLADALQASSVALRIAAERPSVAELLGKLDFVIRNWTAARLRRLG